MPKKRRLCYFGCKNDGPVHQFPNISDPNNRITTDIDKFKSWKSVLDLDTQNKGDNYIYHNIRFCDRHFKSCYKSTSKRLTRNAIPTLNLGEQQSTNELSEITNKETLMPCCGILSNVGNDDETVYLESEMPDSISAEHTTVSLQLMKFSRLQDEDQTPTPESKSDQTSSIIQHQPVIGTRRQFQPDYRDKLILRLQKKLANIKMKYKCLRKKIRDTEKMSLKKSLSILIEKLPDNMKRFIKLQLKSAFKPRGRRFTNEEKNMALSIFKESPRAYKLMKNMFVFPSIRCLQTMVQRKRNSE